MTEFCNVCNKEVIAKDGELIDAKCLKFEEGGDEYFVIRCNECFVKDKSLRNFRSCEVYSRVCGYFRPTSQWNKAKQEEFKDRVVFKQP